MAQQRPVVRTAPRAQGRFPRGFAQVRIRSFPMADAQNGPSPNGLQISGGMAIMAPVSAFPNGVPGNAIIVIPLNKPSDELKEQLNSGPSALTTEQMWKLLGFNGPAVQVQDDQGRPIAIGLEDLLAGLDKHWLEAQDDLQRGRI